MVSEQTRSAAGKTAGPLRKKSYLSKVDGIAHKVIEKLLHFLDFYVI